jgi:hypothetical protein
LIVKNRTSGAKALNCRVQDGTAEAVPFVQDFFRNLFSRAADRAKSWGFSPCFGKTCEIRFGGNPKRRAAAKAIVYLTVCGTTEVVP